MAYSTETTETQTGSSNKKFETNFPFIALTDLKVQLNGTTQTLGASNDYTIAKVNGVAEVTFNTAPSNGDKIRIFRDTNIDAIEAQYQPGSSITARDLNNNNTQLLYAAQEFGTLKGDDSVEFSLGPKGDIFVDSSSAWTITNNAVDNATIANDAVDTAEIKDDAVVASKIADDQINSQHYIAGSIDLEHMSANSVDSDQYVDGSIDLVHMSANSVDSDQYVDGSIDTIHIADSQITTAKIADNNVNLDKLDHGTQGDLLYYGASGAPTRLAKGTAHQVLTINSGATAPEWASHILPKVWYTESKTPQSQVVTGLTWTDIHSSVLNAITISPLSADSKFLFNIMTSGESTEWSLYTYYRIKRAVSGQSDYYAVADSTNIGNRLAIMVGHNISWQDKESTMDQGIINGFIDAPNTTNDITYTLQFMIAKDSQETYHWNRTHFDTDTNTHERGMSWMSIQEVRT